MSKDDKYGKWVHLDWYDGPLSSIATVELEDGHRLVELETLGFWVENGHEHLKLPTWSRAHVRLTREELVKMLDLYDGKPVKGYHDE